MTALRGGWGRSRDGVPASLSSARPPPHHGSKPPYLGKSSDSAVFKPSPHARPSAISLSQPGIGKVALGASRVASRSVLSLGFLIRLRSAWRAGHRGGPQPATATHVPVLEGDSPPSPYPAHEQRCGKWPGRRCRGPRVTERAASEEKACQCVCGRCGGAREPEPSGRGGWDWSSHAACTRTSSGGFPKSPAHRRRVF